MPTGTGVQNVEAAILNGIRTVLSVAPAMPRRSTLIREIEDSRKACERGYFTPDEDERVRAVFARYLSGRAALHDALRELRPYTLEAPGARLLTPVQQMQVFAVGFTIAAILMRTARFVVDGYSELEPVRRKLDEEDPAFGVPRKQFTRIYRSLTQPQNVWAFGQGVRFLEAHSDAIFRLRDDPELAPVVRLLEKERAFIREFHWRDFARQRMRYRFYSWRRRQRSSFQQVMFAIFEASGRAISEVTNPFHTKQVTPDVIREAETFLSPGDVIVTRHHDAMSNLFLPGFWPHAALFIGTAKQRRDLGVSMDDDRWNKSAPPVRVLEAKKDGVRFRPLEETLRVDAFTVIRPRLPAPAIAEGLSRAARHEGKLYDFEFDFSRSDRLVCTEVVYRGFHGLGDLDFPLIRKAGRLVLPAEALLDMARDDRYFDVVTVFGLPAPAPGAGSDGATNAAPGFLHGPQAREALRRQRQYPA